MPRQKDDRTYIRVHDGMPDHPKIEDLSDAAFRLVMRVWCRCSQYQTDGFIKDAWWKKQKLGARRELLNEGLVETVLGGVQVHDYTEHQRTAAEIAEKKAEKKKAGELGNHNRWHEGKKFDPDCTICVANATPGATQKGSQLP